MSVDELGTLAVVKFPDITWPEAHMIYAVDEGGVWEFREDDEERDDLSNATNWGDERNLRAEIFEWLISDIQVRKLIPDSGIQIIGAHILGNITVMFADYCKPLLFENCSIPGDINFIGAQFKTLNFRGSHIGSFNADQMKVTCGVFLNDGFKSEGEISLMGATIGGNLGCGNGKFMNERGCALVVDRAKITGDIFLNNGFKAKGEVRLIGAEIGWNLTCSGGNFLNKNGPSLSADGITVAGAVFLDEGFKAIGTVRLLGAVINGSLACSGGKFLCKDGTAFIADGMKVNGSVFLDDKFEAKGTVRFLGAVIGKDLSCVDAKFLNERGVALSVQRTKVEGSIMLNMGFLAEGMVDITNVTVGSDLHCSGGEFRNGILNSEGYPRFALNANGIEISGDAMMTNQCVVHGLANFSNAEIDGDFQWHGIKNIEGASLDLSSAKIGTLWIGKNEEEDIPILNKLYLHGLVYDSIDYRMSNKSTWWIKFIQRQTTESPESKKKEQSAKALEQEGEDKVARKRRKEAEGLRIFLPQPYEQAAKVLREHGHIEAARNILVEKEKRRTNTINSPLYRIWHRCIGVIIGYGYRPGRGFKWAAFFVILGWVFFLIGKHYEIMIPIEAKANVDSLTFMQSIDYFLQPLFFSFEKFAPLIKLGQQENWIFVNNNPWGIALRWYSWVHTIIGWGLTTLLVAALTGVMKK